MSISLFCNCSQTRWKARYANLHNEVFHLVWEQLLDIAKSSTAVFRPSEWSIYETEVRTNNPLETYNNELRVSLTRGNRTDLAKACFLCRCCERHCLGCNRIVLRDQEGLAADRACVEEEEVQV